MSFNVIEILNRYNIDYKEDKYSSEIKILCPFHDDHSFGSTMINNDTGLFNCYSCGKGGNIYQFVALLEGVSNSDAYKLISSNFSDNTYNIDNLRRIRIKVKESYEVLENKIIFNILDKLRYIGDLQFKHRWLIICNYIKFQRYNEHQLLDIYSTLNKEIKNYDG
ncbi:MAG: CHC2 zinc finger domain-containing protein [Methanogenium sp.]